MGVILGLGLGLVFSSGSGGGIPAGTVNAANVSLPQSGETALALDLSAVPSGNSIAAAVPSASLITLRYFY